VELFLTGDDRGRLEQLQALGTACKLPLYASGDVHMHIRVRRPLQDTLNAIRLNKPLAELGYALYPQWRKTLKITRAACGSGTRDRLASLRL